MLKLAIKLTIHGKYLVLETLNELKVLTWPLHFYFMVFDHNNACTLWFTILEKRYVFNKIINCICSSEHCLP